jgi:hypothetical protein
MSIFGIPPLTQTLEVLLRLIAPVPRPAVDADEIDWQAIDYLARHTHVAAKLWFVLKNDPLIVTAPPALAEGLRLAYIENARRNRLLKAHIRDVARVLNRCGLVPLLLKGGAYIFDPPSSNAALRYLHDLDILSGDAAACQECLLSNGFREVGKIDRPRHERTYHHWPALVDPTTGLEIEVHKRPFITADAAMNALFLAEAVPLQLADVELLLPSRACRIVANVIHSQISERGFGEAWFNPRYLAEFSEYAAAWPATDWALADAAMSGNRIAFGSFRHLAESLMGVRPPVTRQIRAIERVQLTRIRWHERFRPRYDPLGRIIGRIGLIKDRARRRFGHHISWRSIPRRRMEIAGIKS